MVYILSVSMETGGQIMEYIIGIILAALIIFTLSLNTLKGPDRAHASSPESPVTCDVAGPLPSPSPSILTHSLSRKEITERLKKLAQSPPPKDLKMGAMCYAIVGPSDRVDYVCPNCGEKTLYSIDNKERSASTYLIQFELPECRRMAKEIKGITVEFDEHEFCRKCSPGVKEPAMILKVRYSGRTDAAVTRGITRNDLKLINEFLYGTDRHTGEQGRETPLNQYMTRLQQLLGVPGEEKKQ